LLRQLPEDKGGKRAVDLGFEFKDATASSRSSVNNCMERTGSEAAINFSKPPTHAERRRIFKRLRGMSPLQQLVQDKYHSQLSVKTFQWKNV